MDIKQLTESAIERIEESVTDRQREAAKRFFSALEGDQKSRFWLQEGISTSDIPTVLSPAINVLFLAQYADYPTVWREIADEFTAPVDAIGGSTIEWGDFQFDTSQLLGLHDGDVYVGMGLPGVGEYDEYPAMSFSSEELEAALRKYGVRLRVSWEALARTGRFDLIGRSTRAYARYAAEQEDVVLAKQFTAADGTINASFVHITGDPVLDVAGLEAGLDQAGALTVDGRPLGATGYRLVTTPALAPTAERVLATTNYEVTDGSITYSRNTSFGTVRATGFNALAQVGNYTTPNEVNAYWFLVPQGTARPTFLEIFAEGYRTPTISIKDSGHFSVSGGAIPAREGAFVDDSVESRGRHVVSAFAVAPTTVLWSDSTND
jgi:hypothetical protein